MERLAAVMTQTLKALGTFDADQLERLATGAEACRDSMARITSAPIELRSLRDSLADALQSTDSRLRVLRGLRREDTSWVR